MRHAIVVALIAVFVASPPGMARADVFTAGADLAANMQGPQSNPYGPWTYGTAPAVGLQNQGVDLTQFTPYGAGQITTAWNGVGSLQGYTDNDSNLTSIIVANIDPFSAVGACCGFSIDPLKIFVHAGVDQARDAIVQWTAPEAGYVTISADWVLKGSAPAMHQIFQNSTAVTNASFGSETYNSSILVVAAGDIFSFVQGPQASGAFGSTSTQFDASIDFTAGPLPNDRSWAFDHSGDWNTGSNWAPNLVPNSNDVGAVFGSSITTPATVFTNTAVTVRQVAFDNANSYAIAGTGSVNLQADTGNAALNVAQGTHEFQARVNLLSDTTASIAAGATLECNNRLDLGGKTLTKTGDGTLKINNVLNTGGGAVNLTAGVVGGGGSIAGNLANASGTVAPGDNAGTLTVQGSYSQAASGILSVQLAGASSGSYDVLQVNQAATLDGTLAVSLVGGYQPHTGDVFTVLTAGGGFAGTSFSAITGNDLSALSPGFRLNRISDAQSIGLLAALPGDADLNKTADFTDLGILLNNYNQSAGSGAAEWGKGDFDDNHVTDFTDLGILLNNYGLTVSLAGSAAPVPEPSTFTLLALSVFGMMLAWRRRRRTD